MSLSLTQLRDTIGVAGVPPQTGFDLRAVLASIAYCESSGDAATLILGDKDPIRFPKGPAVGLFQVETGEWPEVASKIRNIIGSAADEKTKAVYQTRAVAPIIKDALTTTLRALRVLTQRGFPVGPETIALLIDASWQHSPATVVGWAGSTLTGDASSIDPRAVEFLSHYRTLSPDSGMKGFLMFFGLLGGLGLLLWLIQEMEDAS